jgi:hypothetical protein
MEATKSATGLYLTRSQASAYILERFGLVVAPKTLGKYATVGGGPAYSRFGRAAVYSAAALDSWVAEKLTAPRRAA